MSFWSGFTDILKNTFGGIAGANPAAIATQAGANMAGMGQDPRVAAQVGIASTGTVKGKFYEANIATVDNAAQQAFDPVLWLGDKAEKYVFSPLIARPISTLNLLSDPTSKLYQNNQYGAGFQLSDITAAYNRTGDEYKTVNGEKVLVRKGVSLGQSLVKNPFSLIGIAESKLLEINGVDVSGIDLWNDQDIQENFVDNTLGKYITGLNDFVIKNVAVEVATAGAAGAVRAGLTRAGYTTKIKATDINAMPKYEKDISDHIDFIEGKGGTQTVIGQDVIDLAASDNIIDIHRIARKHSYNPNLPDLLLKTKDPRVVGDFLLADKGYGPAIERLSKLEMRDDLWVLGDGTATFRAEYIKNGKLPDYTPEQRARWGAAFDDAIKRNPKHKDVYDAFLTEQLDEATGALNIEPYALGKAYRPMEPKGLQGPAGAVRSKAGKLKTAIVERDFTNPQIGGVAQTVLGGGRLNPTTVLLRRFGTFMPQGLVTNSGLQPMNGIRELISVFDDVPLFTDGTKMIKTHDVVDMTVSDYRRNLISKFTSAKTDGERALVIKNANKELAKTIAYSRGYFDAVKIEGFVDQLMEDVYKMHGQFRATGTATDPTGVRLVVDPQTQRQLANSMPMLPFGELDRMIVKAVRKEKGPIRGAATSVEQGLAASAKNIFEATNRVFSVAQLYRFSYIPKNSIFEPLLAATLAEGSKVTVPLFTQASKSIIKSTSDVIMRNIEKSKTLLPSAKKEIQKEIKALSEQYNLAIINRDQVYANYASMFEDIPGVSPASKRDWADEIRGALKDAENDVAAIESKLNAYTIDYGKPYDVPSVYNLRSRIETLKSVGKTAEAEVVSTFDDVLRSNPNISQASKEYIGLVNTNFIKKYLEFDRKGADAFPEVSAQTIAEITADLKAGKGFNESLVLDYWVDDNGNLLLNLSEGNHRLAAAIDAGIKEVPVKIMRGYQANIDAAKLVGKSKVLPDRSGYIPGYVNPKDILPSVAMPRTAMTARAEAAARYASEIRTAELTLQKAVGEINTLAPDLNIIDTQLAEAYARIGKTLEELGPKNLEMARLFSVAEKRYAKKPLVPETYKVQLSNGQTLELDSISSRRGMGEGLMSEISNNKTRTLEFLGNKATVAKMNTIFSRTPKSITNVSDPTYFDQLAYVVNNHMRGDVLVDRILSGQSREDIISQWSKSSQARWYAEQRGYGADDIVRLIDEEIGYVNRYLPTSDAKLAAFERDVMPEQLRGLLGDKLDQMVPIQPLDVDYAKPTIGQKMDTILASTWKTMMKPENVIREVWANAAHKSIITERLNALIAQGYTIDLSTLNRIHHRAAIEVADNVKNVFYTIPRQHRALYLARGLATFPNAAASGIYRYGKFAVQKPARFAGFLNSYYSFYGSFGVDQYGNPVDDPMKAQYLLIPGTKEMGLNDGKGIIINARATNYVVNFPGASWIAPIALSAILGGKPNSSDEIKKAIDSTIGKIPGYSYDELFPYGIEQSTTNVAYNTFTPAWARNLRQAISPDLTNKMFVDSWISESNRQWIVYDMMKDKNPNYSGPAPTPESIMDGAKNIYLRKFRTQMFSILGTPQVVESRPDKVYQDYFFKVYNTNIAKGQSDSDAWKNAETEFQAHMLKATGAKFPMDRLFVSSQDSIAYIQPSQKAYERIWQDFPELASKLRQVDPSVVNLMVADLPKEYSPQVNRFLNSTTATLPDGTYVNERLKTPALVEQEIEVSRFWAAYTAKKKEFNKIATDAKYASYLSVPELKDALKDYAVNVLGKASPAWFNEYDKGISRGNQAQLQAKGLFTAVSDPQFMAKFGKTQFWQHAKAFVTYRNDYAKAYAVAPSGNNRGQKGYIAAQWQAYLATTRDLWDPTLGKMIDRYFENDNLKESR